MPQRSAPRAALSVAEKQARAVELVDQGKTFQQIADDLEVSRGYAHKLFRAGLNRIPAENVQAYRERQLGDIELARAIVLEELAIYHVTVSNGYVVRQITGYDADGHPEYGDPIEDRGPIMGAVDRLIKLSEREAAILGSDAERKLHMSGSVKYEVVGLADGDLA